MLETTSECLAQDKDSTDQQPVVTYEKDSLFLYPEEEHSPGKAALYSAVLPGLGQAYNKKYWKIPVIYGLGATLGYYISFNNNQYLRFRDSFFAKTSGNDDDPFPSFSQDQVKVNKDYFRRNRDFLIIITTALYGLNIVDATVDAHLKSFDVGDDLTLSIEPSFEQYYQQPLAGLSLRFIFK